MKTKSPKKRAEAEIDAMVIAQANDNTAWEKPIRVRKPKSTALTIPTDLAARAAFLAHVHRMKTVEEWVTHVIQERIELEEAAYAGVKEAIAVKAS